MLSLLSRSPGYDIVDTAYDATTADDGVGGPPARARGARPGRAPVPGYSIRVWLSLEDVVVEIFIIGCVSYLSKA